MVLPLLLRSLSLMHTGRAAELPGGRAAPVDTPPHASLQHGVRAPTARSSFSAGRLPTWSAGSPVSPYVVCECHPLAEIISRLCLTDKHLALRLESSKAGRRGGKEH